MLRLAARLEDCVCFPYVLLGKLQTLFGTNNFMELVDYLRDGTSYEKCVKVKVKVKFSLCFN
jgi:hypothetical protein